MLSILIPVFNFPVVEFVQDLHQQALLAQVPFEIRCYDDESDITYRKANSPLQSFENVIYKELEKNVGRSRIRNKLAREAKYQYLLFADCDARTTNFAYIQRYVDTIQKWGSTQLVVDGGHQYPEHPPASYNALLHWTYGKNKDTLPAEKRQNNPYLSFKTINFLIAKDLFLNIGFNEQLKGYGHEDTMMALSLRDKQIQIHHIDNPLCHLGLVDNQTFLAKTKESVKNLAYLIKKGYLKNEIKLSRTYFWLKWLGLRRVILYLFNQYQEKMRQKLMAEKPSLRLLDLYKLGLLVVQMAQLSEETKS